MILGVALQQEMSLFMITGMVFPQAKMVLLALEQFMIVRLYLQQAKILGLFFTSYDFRCGLLACYD